ncbi:MAG: hypothetical protein WBA13_23080 [Microcoleaceae cyanobacterium]
MRRKGKSPRVIKLQTRPYPVKTKFGFLSRWIFATIAGFAISLFWVEVGERPDLGVMQGILGGLVIGISQWLVLRQYITQPWQWIFATVIAWGILGYSHLGVLGFVAPSSLNLGLRLFYGCRDGFLIGLWLGLWHWWALRGQVLKSRRWLWWSPWFWGIGLALGWGVGGLLRQLTGIFLAEVIGLSLTWAIVGGCMGKLLTQLLWIEKN